MPFQFLLKLMSYFEVCLYTSNVWEDFLLWIIDLGTCKEKDWVYSIWWWDISIDLIECDPRLSGPMIATHSIVKCSGTSSIVSVYSLQSAYIVNTQSCAPVPLLVRAFFDNQRGEKDLYGEVCRGTGKQICSYCKR